MTLGFIKNIKKRYLIIGGVIIVVLVAAIILNKPADEQAETNFPKNVSAVTIEKDTYNQNFIKTVASVNPETKINVVALTNGTVKSVSFNNGDTVKAGQILASLNNNSTLTNLNTARSGVINSEGAFISTERIINETIKQAELGVSNAEESLEAAQISLNSSQDNLDNTIVLKSKTNEDAKNNAVTTYNSYLNSIFNTIDYSNNILDIEDENQIAGINKVLGVKNLSTINAALNSYRQVDNTYKMLKEKNISTENVTEEMGLIINLLESTKIHIDNMVSLLENSISGEDFSESALDTQKNIFYGERANIVATIVSAKSLKQTLDNLDLVYNSEIDALENAVKSAESRLESARLGLTNAQISLANAQESGDQQLINSKAGLDNARGQLGLAQNQASDLTLRAPISGIITMKSIELGAELNPGQMVAEISQNEFLKIEFSVNSQDVYRIEKGQTVNIGENVNGTIYNIDPIADPITRQVGVEVLVKNDNTELIQGTFVDVSIPVKPAALSSDNSLLVPIKAVTVNQNENYIFVSNSEEVDGEQKIVARKRTISTGLVEGALIEVVSGLQTGESIIIEGAKNLNDGDSVILN